MEGTGDGSIGINPVWGRLPPIFLAFRCRVYIKAGIFRGTSRAIIRRVREFVKSLGSSRIRRFSNSRGSGWVATVKSGQVRGGGLGNHGC